jgi:hypothetical protein
MVTAQANINTIAQTRLNNSAVNMALIIASAMWPEGKE